MGVDPQPLNSAAQSALELELVDEQAKSNLLKLIRRVDPNANPIQFAETVSMAFQRAQRALSLPDMEPVFRQSQGDTILREALSAHRDRMANKHGRALAIGCGASYAGASGAYVASVLEDVLGSAGWIIQRVDLTRSDLETAAIPGRYDAVVSHSVAHFVPNLAALFRYMAKNLMPGGSVILSREPNQRFWKNSELLQAERMMDDPAHSGKKPVSSSLRLARTIRQRILRRPVPLFKETNRILRLECGYRSVLSPREIARLVDPHFPSDYPGAFSAGFPAFDWDVLGERFLPHLRLRSVRTWAHTGRRNEAAQKNREQETLLARKHPHDGTFFSAVWQDPATV